ncbi:hypothetical protein E3N88_15057 [Mikania micrantha]|uniref:Uncharacterized protein n=1 Tax=Mikania micrantha TaxID=192012 RepID=A0A5N6P4J4_9ASTR|nr:hypothetical protein E3N88_15057 [Mikania micrantha]
MLRQRHEMSLAEFAVITGLYWEPETVTPLYTAGITEIDDATLRAWWPLIADDPFAGTKARVTRIRDPLIRYMHRLIATSIAGRGRSREWCTLQDLFYLYCLITGRTCQLARCLAEYFATYYHRQQRGAIYGGAYITIIGRALVICTRTLSRSCLILWIQSDSIAERSSVMDVDGGVGVGQGGEGAGGEGDEDGLAGDGEGGGGEGAGVMRRVGGGRRRSLRPAAFAAEIPYSEASGTPRGDTAV